MRLTLFQRLCLTGTLLALTVVVLGAWVRLSDAGLGCPDWPGCYGHLTVGQALQNAEHLNRAYPERPLEAGKAFKEMLHRYLAAGLGLLIVAVAAYAWTKRREPGQPTRLPLLLVFFGVLGGLFAFGFLGLFLGPTLLAVGYVLFQEWSGDLRSAEIEPRSLCITTISSPAATGAAQPDGEVTPVQATLARTATAIISPAAPRTRCFT